MRLCARVVVLASAALLLGSCGGGSKSDCGRACEIEVDCGYGEHSIACAEKTGECDALGTCYSQCVFAASCDEILACGNELVMNAMCECSAACM